MVTICDRCGKKVESRCSDDPVEDIKDSFIKFVIGMILEGIDLCCECRREIFEKLMPKILELRKEVNDWLKKGGG